MERGREGEEEVEKIYHHPFEEYAKYDLAAWRVKVEKLETIMPIMRLICGEPRATRSNSRRGHARSLMVVVIARCASLISQNYGVFTVSVNTGKERAQPIK